MVIYQKQHRLAHRQHCVLLSESRLTRFPPPSKKAFFPSSHIFRVNIKCIIKTLFSSKCGGTNFKKKDKERKLCARQSRHKGEPCAPRNVAALPGRTQDGCRTQGSAGLAHVSRRRRSAGGRCPWPSVPVPVAVPVPRPPAARSGDLRRCLRSEGFCE